MDIEDRQSVDAISGSTAIHNPVLTDAQIDIIVVKHADFLELDMRKHLPGGVSGVAFQQLSQALMPFGDVYQALAMGEEPATRPTRSDAQNALGQAYLALPEGDTKRKMADIMRELQLTPSAREEKSGPSSPVPRL